MSKILVVIKMWKGVIIEESLEDKSLLKLVTIVQTRLATLEHEEEKGSFFMHHVTVEDDAIDRVVDKAKRAIKKGWYMHFCRSNMMVVIFKNRVFKHMKGNDHSLYDLIKYGKSIGINEAQLPTDELIDNPWG